MSVDRGILGIKRPAEDILFGGSNPVAGLLTRCSD